MGLPITTNYVQQPFICRVRTTHYVADDYQEYELLFADAFYSARADKDLGFDGNDLPFGEGFYDYDESNPYVGFAVVDREGNRFEASKVIPVAHLFNMGATEDHTRINYSKGLVSASLRLDIWCRSNRDFRFRGVEYGVIPRRAISTRHAKGVVERSGIKGQRK